MAYSASVSARNILGSLKFSGNTGGYVAAFSSAVVMSLIGVIIKYISDEYALAPAQLAFWRNALVFLVLLPVLSLLRIPVLVKSRTDNRILLLFGFMLALMNFDWTIAVIEIGASVATVLCYCSAAYSGILGWMFLGEKMSRGLALSVAICLGGCALVCGVMTPVVWQGMSTVGLVTGVASGFLYAGYGMVGRLAGTRGINPWVSLLHSFGYASIFQLIFNALAAWLVPSWGLGVMSLEGFNMELGCWLAMLVLALGPTLIGLGLYNVALSSLSVGLANTILLLEPALAAVFAFFMLGEALTPLQWTGILLITGGVAVLPGSSSSTKLTEEHAVAVSDAVGAVGAAVQAVPEAVGNAVQAVPDVVTAAVQAVPEAVSTAVQAVPEAVGNAVQAVPDAVTAAVQAVPEVVSNAVQAVPEAVGNAVQAMPEAVTAAVQAVPAAVVNAVQAVPGVVAAAVQAVPDAVSNAVQSVTASQDAQVASAEPEIKVEAPAVQTSVSQAAQA